MNIGGLDGGLEAAPGARHHAVLLGAGDGSRGLRVLCLSQGRGIILGIILGGILISILGSILVIILVIILGIIIVSIPGRYILNSWYLMILGMKQIVLQME